MRLSLERARRIAVRAQQLSGPPRVDLVETVDRLAAVRIDFTAAVCPSADHILYSRLGPGYQPDQLRRALDDRVLVELDGWVRPMDDLAILLPAMREPSPSASVRDWLAANAGFRRDVLDRIRADGPSVATEIPDSSAVPWPSTGWTNAKNVQVMIELLHKHGELAVVGRRGRTREWDLAERVYPSDLPAFTADAAQRLRDERRLAAHGILRAKDADASIGRTDLREIGEAASIEGLAGEWRVDPGALAGGGFDGGDLDDDALDYGAGTSARDEPRTVLLTPLDAFCYDRERLRELFDFEYALEMYKPAAKRKWGFFALPILDGDRLVGKLDAAADRKKGVLRVNAIHEEAPETRGPWNDDLRERVEVQIDRLADWLGLERAGP